MKFVILFIFGVIVAAAVGAGAVYVIQPTAQKEDYKSRIEANEAAVAGLKSTIEKSNSDRVAATESLNENILALSGRIEELEKKLEEISKAPTLRPVSEKIPADEEAPAEIEELVEKVVKEREEERQKERQAQMAERMAGMQKMMQDWVTNHVNEFAKKKNWNIAKQQEVSSIIDESMKKAGELFRRFRGGGPPSPETFEKMREIMEETEAKLKEVMTEEEWKEFQESMPGPGMFGPGRMRPRGSDQNQPEGR